MKVKIFDKLDSLSKYAASSIADELKLKNNLLLCAASGGSPTLTYNYLTDYKNDISFENLCVVKLDEWGGVPMSHEGSCETYLQQNLIAPLQIRNENFYSFQSTPENPEDECKRIQKLINQHKQIDICILGLGQNGHIAFNEPSEFLQPNCHVVTLSESSMNHPMAKNMKSGTVYGITLGMKDILDSKRIIIIVTGKNKHEIIKQFLSKKISTQLPASFLWLHQNIDCLIDEESINEEIASMIQALKPKF